jgi:hypothetical protein
LRKRDKGVHAIDIHQDATAVVAGHLSFKDLAGLVPDGQCVPAFFAARTVKRDDGMAFGGGRLEDHHLHGVASLELGGAFDTE